MVFSSNIFLFVFLPAFLGIYFLSPTRWRNAWIVLGSYAFYAWWRLDFLALFVGVTLVNYVVGRRIFAAQAVEAHASARRWMVAGVVADLAVLGYFKYANFGVDSFNLMLTSAGVAPFHLADIVLPIGISFYTFQAVSYVIDVYRRDTPPADNLVDFAAFIALFPQLIAGPVLRYKDLAPQFKHRPLSADLFGEGVARFMQGFIKKVLIADSVAPLVDAGFALEDPTMADAWLTTLAYTVQLYFDFSGYTDMAIGLGLMMGFRFIENFRQPYVSQSITEFWRRWHISLSTWLKDYLYISLGGNRRGKVRTYINLLLTMVLGGLWHGANWTFVVWGAWHGAILAVERMLGVNGSPKGFNPARWAVTFLFVMLGWVAFRAETLGDAGRLYAVMFGAGDLALSPAYAAAISQFNLALLGLGVAVLLLGGLRDRLAAAGAAHPGGHPLVLRWAGALALPIFVAAVLKLSADSYSPFLYFQF
ncbi:MAG: membrane-bound O-acyltransferase family protein [Xanthomonadales bacterium]|nr:membrane-bound O-acyltransferase family protein [Xanthomonadales bacterium]